MLYLVEMASVSEEIIVAEGIIVSHKRMNFVDLPFIYYSNLKGFINKIYIIRMLQQKWHILIMTMDYNSLDKLILVTYAPEQDVQLGLDFIGFLQMVTND